MIFFTLFFSVASALASPAPKITEIFDGEFNMDSGACWITGSQSKTILYSQHSNEITIKLDSKVTSLKSDKKMKKDSFLQCGEKYKYISSDKKTTVEVDLYKKDSKTCSAVIKVSDSKETNILKDLKFDCSNI